MGHEDGQDRAMSKTAAQALPGLLRPQAHRHSGMATAQAAEELWKGTESGAGSGFSSALPAGYLLGLHFLICKMGLLRQSVNLSAAESSFPRVSVLSPHQIAPLFFC